MALMKKLVEPGEPLEFGLYIEYKTKKVNETTKKIETAVKTVHIGSDQLWGDGVHWEAAVVGGNLGFGEVIADKVTIELITDKVNIDFNNFETGVIRELSFSKIGKNSPGYTGLLYDLLFIEDIQHRYDNQVIKITAYTTLKYLNQVVRTKELKTSKIATRNAEVYTMANGNKGMRECKLVIRDLPDVVDILEDLEEKYLIPSFNSNYGYVGTVVTNKSLRDQDLKEAGLMITRETINGSVEKLATLGDYKLESWRYYLDTKYVKDKDLTVKDLISMIAEKFGVFVRPKVYVQNKTVYVVFCYEWFDKENLMKMTKTLNKGGKITEKEETNYLKSLYHKPSIHIIDEYFSHNINPKKERLTSCVNVYEGVSGPWVHTTNFDEDLNQLNQATGVIETGKDNHLSNTNHYKKNVAYGLEDSNITLDKLYAIRAAKRFRNDASDYNYNELKSEIGQGTEILEYYSGSIDIPLDVYIHPGDALIVNINGKYIPMLVGSVSAGSGGSMTIKSPPLKSFATTQEYSDEYYNKNNLTSGGGRGQDGKDGADGKKGNNGKSAYEIAVDNGFVGNEKAWLDSLKGGTADIDYNLVVRKVFEQMENAETGRY